MSNTRGVSSALLSLFLALAAVSVADAAPNLSEPLKASLFELRRGDAKRAYDDLRALFAKEPENLGAECGILLALDALGFDEDPARATEFETRIDKLVDHASARRNRNSGDREALFYLAQAYGARAGYRFEHGKGIWGAARDAAKAKRLSDEYVRLAPSDADGYYTLGLYNYYVAIAPSFVKVLNVLLFLPSGNRTEGLKQIERAQTGDLWGQEAQFQLVDICSDLEGRPDDALRLSGDLRRLYPDNPKVQFTYAELLQHPTVENYAAAGEAYDGIVTRVRAGHPNYRNVHLHLATSGLAGAYQQQWRIEEAIDAITPAIDANIDTPRWLVPTFLLRRGAYRAQLGDDRWREDLNRIVNDRKYEPWHKAARRQMKTMDERIAGGYAAIATALVPGNRLAAERRWNEAEASYAQVVRTHPGAPQVTYRQALLEFERNRLDRAAELFNAIIVPAARAIPTWVRGPAMLYRARIHDLWNQREHAVNLYKRIVDEFDEGDFAVRAAKVGIITPYRRVSKPTT